MRTIMLEEGFTALITGGSSGLGFEMAKALLSSGARVVIGARPGKKLEYALEELKKCGDAYAVPMDVSSEESVEEAQKWFIDHFDRLDLLVNNAGIGNNAPGMETLAPNHLFYDVPAKGVRDVLETNFLGFFLVSRAFVPLMVQRGRGSVTYVSTNTEITTARGMIPYGPSKAGAEAMATIMSDELRDSGIMVNVITPGGFTDTNMAGRGEKEFFVANNLPILPPTILNDTILFLASSASQGLTGEKITGTELDQWLKDNNIDF